MTTEASGRGFADRRAAASAGSQHSMASGPGGTDRRERQLAAVSASGERLRSSSASGQGSLHLATGLARERMFGEGPLARVVAPIYQFLVVDLLLLATSLPALIPLVLLDRDASNAPLAVVCALPVGPAVSAALYALRHRSRDITELRPAADFWRGYRMNVGGVLRAWVPFLGGMALIAEDLSHAPGGVGPILAVLAVVATLWAMNALVITSLFAFRPVDVARLAVYFLGRTRRVTLGNLGLLLAAALVVGAASEAVLALFGVLFAAALVHTCAPMIGLVEREFTA